MTRENYSLLFNSTDLGTFRCARRNRSYTQDLCFVSQDTDRTALPAIRKILRGFPSRQHRPIIVDVGLKLPFVRTDKKNRWNFNKAYWSTFSQTINETILRIPDQASGYDRFVELVKSAASNSMRTPRRTQRIYDSRLG